ncbi:MAG: hypothetical protein B0D92_04720 [Spirochaeta sp. LUC14_002_19_P3]|nr:MAG: hypothetical protein B0D92_04720 [Spirochaeta sp. LUC14_002_19_P3]
MVEAAALRDKFHHLHNSKKLPDTDELNGILEAALHTLSAENPLIRPPDTQGRPGGLILLRPDKTAIIVPDLHARTGYITALMDMELSGKPVLDALLAGELQIICVGDGFHSEARGYQRWQLAWQEFLGGYRRHKAIDGEMRENLALMAMVMMLKSAAPDGFHFLKGNHENVTNSNSAGNREFGKFVAEGEMVAAWFRKFPGVEMLKKWDQFEAALPLLAVGDFYMISHAEPRIPYSREDVIAYRNNAQLISDFTWTGNDEAEEGSVASMLSMYLGARAEDALYFGGHRPVEGIYKLRAGGRYVQIHNPQYYIAAIIQAGQKPQPERDIIRLKED